MPDRQSFAKQNRKRNSSGDGIERAYAYLQRNFRRTPALPEIADVAGVSRFHFHRLFRQRFGKTPKRVITELQVAEVQRLARGGMSLGEAARAAGFVHQSHMTLRFKQVVGQTPLRWLKAARAAGGALLVGVAAGANQLIAFALTG